MLVVSTTRTIPLATKYGTWRQGQPIDPTCIPREKRDLLLAQWKKAGVITENGIEDTIEELPDHDILSNMSRTELLRLIRPNGLVEVIQPTKSWSEEKIRAEIRKAVPNLENLIVPPPLAS